MTNKEKYQRTFSTLHASEDILMEVKTMKTKHKVYVSKLAAVCAAAVLVLALASAAYAADIGGIQKRLQIWSHGEQADVIMEAENGQYTLYRENENGEREEIGGGGGVAIDQFGNERPLTPDELMEDFDGSRPEIEFEDDGTAKLYYKDQVIVLTDFDADGFCYYKLNDGERDMYLTIKYRHGWAVDYDGFNTPKSSFVD